MLSEIGGTTIAAAVDGLVFGGAYHRFFTALSQGDPFSWSLLGVLLLGGIAWYKVKTWRSAKD